MYKDLDDVVLCGETDAELIRALIELDAPFLCRSKAHHALKLPEGKGWYNSSIIMTWYHPVPDIDYKFKGI